MCMTLTPSLSSIPPKRIQWPNDRTRVGPAGDVRARGAARLEVSLFNANYLWKPCQCTQIKYNIIRRSEYLFQHQPSHFPTRTQAGAQRDVHPLGNALPGQAPQLAQRLGVWPWRGFVLHGPALWADREGGRSAEVGRWCDTPPSFLPLVGAHAHVSTTRNHTHDSTHTQGAKRQRRVPRARRLFGETDDRESPRQRGRATGVRGCVFLAFCLLVWAYLCGRIYICRHACMHACLFDLPTPPPISHTNTQPPLLYFTHTLGLKRPNGLAFSPDFSTLYVANSDADDPKWVALDIDPKTGLMKKGDEEPRLLASATAFKGLDGSRAGNP